MNFLTTIIYKFEKFLHFAERFRGQCEAGEDVDAIAHDQFLRQALGDVAARTAGVLADDFDLLAGDAVAVLLHVQLDAVVDLCRGVGELARIGGDDADLDGALRAGRGGKPGRPSAGSRGWRTGGTRRRAG